MFRLSMRITATTEKINSITSSTPLIVIDLQKKNEREPDRENGIPYPESTA